MSMSKVMQVVSDIILLLFTIITLILYFSQPGLLFKSAGVVLA